MPYKTKTSDKNIVENIRFRWPELASSFTDLQLAHLYSEFSISEDFGNNDEKFHEWLFAGPLADDF
jgi:hypothetical protein